MLDNEATPREPRGYAAILRQYAEEQGRSPVCAGQRVQGAQGDKMAPMSTALSMPILHFATGGASPERLRILRSFNVNRDYAAIEPMLDEPPTPLQRFQDFSLRWILAVMNGSPGAANWKRKAECYRQTPAQRAGYRENIAFELIVAGKLAEAKESCRTALQKHVTSQGLWINLLVAMSGLNEHAHVELLLLKLPRVIDVDRGLLGIYLEEDPEFTRPVCNGG